MITEIRVRNHDATRDWFTCRAIAKESGGAACKKRVLILKEAASVATCDRCGARYWRTGIATAAPLLVADRPKSGR